MYFEMFNNHEISGTVLRCFTQAAHTHISIKQSVHFMSCWYEKPIFTAENDAEANLNFENFLIKIVKLEGKRNFSEL